MDRLTVGTITVLIIGPILLVASLAITFDNCMVYIDCFRGSMSEELYGLIMAAPWSMLLVGYVIMSYPRKNYQKSLDACGI